MASFKDDGRMIFLMFFGLIITATLIGPIADSVFTETNTITLLNVTVTVPAVNATLDLVGRTLILQTADISLANNASNFSNGMFLQSGIGTSGLQSVQLTLNDTAAAFAGDSVNVSYTAQPDGFVQDAGARSITTLIVLFSALAMLIFVVVILFQNPSFKNLIGRG